MWFQNENGDFEKSTNPEIVTYHAMLQELQLWKGENPMDTEAGIDYEGIFNNRTFLSSELQAVLDKYSSSFSELELLEIETSDNNEVQSAKLKIQFKSGKAIIKELNLKE